MTEGTLEHLYVQSRLGLETAKKLDLIHFYESPASTRFHGAYPGGLFDHSKAVAENLVWLTAQLGLKWQRPDSPVRIGILHDICKCDCYILCSDGSYRFNRDAESGHGDKSVFVAQRLGLQLTVEEELCIRWHMGAFDEKENWSEYTEAIHKYPNVLYTHTADMIVAHIDMC